MTGGLFSNAKMTLVFAGGVIGTAVLFAGYYAPAIVERAGEQTQAPDEPVEESTQDSAEPADDDADAAASFGDFAGFADDSELIDEATGFDPSPPGEDSLIVIPGGSAPSGKAVGDDGGPATNTDWGDSADAAPPARVRRENRQARIRASQITRRGNPRPDDLSVAQMKARLATPPRISSADE